MPMRLDHKFLGRKGAHELIRDIWRKTQIVVRIEPEGSKN
jgi:hypothetical protein